MSSWLKKTSNEILLFHSSDAPYFLTENYVLLCGSNCFFEKQPDSNYVSFYANKNSLKQIYANCWKIEEFPFDLPLGKIVELKNAKTTSKNNKKHKTRIAIAKSNYVKKLMDKDIYLLFSNCEKTFLLSKEASSDQKIRLADELAAEHIFCGKSWYVAMLKILDHLCLDAKRDKDWCSRTHDLTVELYGIKGFKELDFVRKVIEKLGLSEKVDLILK